MCTPQRGLLERIPTPSPREMGTWHSKFLEVQMMDKVPCVIGHNMFRPVSVHKSDQTDSWELKAC